MNKKTNRRNFIGRGAAVKFGMPRCQTFEVRMSTSPCFISRRVLRRDTRSTAKRQNL